MGKPAKPLIKQARAFLKARYLALGTSRHHTKRQADTPPRIHSIRTFETYASCIARAAQTMDVVYIKHLSPELAQQYMSDRAAAGYSQKQLASDRRALYLLTGVELPKAEAFYPPKNASRAYTGAQVELITRHQTPAHALATRLAYTAGLRGQELLTLRREGEGDPPSKHRRWHPERFIGREGVLYLVTGKGGLTREVLVPDELAVALEKRRLPFERQVRDRGVNGLVQRYDLPGGNAWGSAFSAASKRALGFSRGGHGLRHSYAQERMQELARGLCPDYQKAREIVAGELGHFRGAITEKYLR